MAKGKIKNKNKKPTAKDSYYFVAHQNDGEVIPLLLTDAEFERAKIRAEMNPEDVPLDFITFQQQHKKSE